jgi:hypothetical protein
VKALRKSNELDSHVESLANSIANLVNRLERRETAQQPNEDLEDALRRQRSALMMAESDALREYLPRDEESEGKIGPSGGYED